MPQQSNASHKQPKYQNGFRRIKPLLFQSADAPRLHFMTMGTFIPKLRAINFIFSVFVRFFYLLDQIFVRLFFEGLVSFVAYGFKITVIGGFRTNQMSLQVTAVFHAIFTLKIVWNVFPEGTRNPVPDTFLKFHSASFKIAEKTGCAIIPMSINNAGAIFEDHLPKIKKTHVVIEYGKPIYTKDLDKESRRHISETIQETIKEMYFKNKELV